MNYSHWIYRQGFTSKLKSYFYILPLTKENTVLGALLTRILERGSRDYPSSQAIQAREDELYGAAAFFDLNIYGSLLVFEAKLIHPNYLYFDREDLEEEAEEFLDSLLYKPLLDKEGNFRQDFFLQEKDMLQQDLESLSKDPQALAFRKSLEIVFEGGKLGLNRHGDLETLAQVGLEDLKVFYQDLLASPLYVYYHGLDKKQDQGKRPQHSMDKPGKLGQYGEVFQDLDIGQSNSVFTYSLPWDYQDPRVFACLVLSHLLGGMASSRLFKEIREEQGLCYSIYSRYDRYRQLVFILVGHDKDQYTQLKEGIEDEFTRLIEEGLEEGELEETKRDMIIGLSSISDNQGRHLRDVFVRDIFGDHREIDKRIELIEAVSEEEVLEAARSLRPSLIYSVRNR